MLGNVWFKPTVYINAMQKLAIDTWQGLTPSQYGILLISIGICGWMLLNRRGW